MINVSSNAKVVFDQLQGRLNDILKNKEEIMLPVVQNVAGEMKVRIHTDGKDANGSQIGTYSKGYMKYGRPKFNRTSDTKVIASLTRAMENDFKVISTSKGYGIGFSNIDNYAKTFFVEATYKKKIWELTHQELQLALTIGDRIKKHIAG